MLLLGEAEDVGLSHLFHLDPRVVLGVERDYVEYEFCAAQTRSEASMSHIAEHGSRWKECLYRQSAL